MAATAYDLVRERHWVCARRMSERRHELGLTQNDVVRRLGAAGAATTNRMLSSMENGQGIDVGRLPELAAALDCTITYLLGLTEDPARWEPDAVRRAAGAPDRAEHDQDGVVWILGPDVPERAGNDLRRA